MSIQTVQKLGTITLVTLILLANVTSAYGSTAALRASAVPEPGVLALLGGGLIGLAAYIRRRLSD